MCWVLIDIRFGCRRIDAADIRDCRKARLAGVAQLTKRHDHFTRPNAVSTPPDYTLQPLQFWDGYRWWTRAGTTWQADPPFPLPDQSRRFRLLNWGLLAVLYLCSVAYMVVSGRNEGPIFILILVILVTFAYAAGLGFTYLIRKLMAPIYPAMLGNDKPRPGWYYLPTSQEWRWWDGHQIH